ncbi:diacylglycerol kinase [Nocardia callitridis]|uniref:Diacylglycerol kinase n=2 Tax=Nocardia callitridis TaxID=648753 RepID=A0ABP9L3H0_9NOCA
MVTNPASGLGRASAVAAVAAERLRARGVEVVEVRTDSAAESVRQVRHSIACRRPDAVVSVGGDGLMNVLLPAVAQTGVPLALVPAGSGNDLARVFDIPTKNTVAAADIVLDGRTRTIDLGRLESAESGSAPMWFATVVGTGFDARVTLRANEMEWPKGRSRYTAAAVAELSHKCHAPYRVTMSDASTEGLRNPGVGSAVRADAVMVAVGNTSTYGGGMLICPDAIPDDGLLDLTVVGELSRFEMMRLLPVLAAGKPTTHPKVVQFRASEITVSAPGTPVTADGEPAGMLPITIRSVPAALTVLAPAGRW